MQEDTPDYMVNSLVDIDGGTGSNNLTIVGTELGDRYVIKNGKYAMTIPSWLNFESN